MELFQFKKFSIKQNSASVFKVNTEAVLLSAWVELQNCQNILEIGSGTGVISIGMHQRLSNTAQITSIDIDQNAYHLTQENIQLNKISNIKAINSSLIDFCSQYLGEPFDLIISNPPYFDTALKSQKPRNILAKYTDSLSYQTLIELSKQQIHPSGKIALVLPFSDLKLIQTILSAHKLNITRQLNVRTVSHKPALRVLLEITKQKVNHSLEIDELIIKDENNQFTDAYRAMTLDYYTIF